MSEQSDTERPTQPDTVPPERRATRDSFDPDSWHDTQLQALVDGMKELKASREAFDPEVLISRAAERFAAITDANYQLLLKALQDLGLRVTASESSIVELRREFAELKGRIVGLEARLEAHVRGQNAAEQAAAPPG